MKAFKGIFWALVLSALLWIAMLAVIPAICHEVDMRREKVENKAKVYQWWHERDLNQHITQKEWTR